MTKRTSRTYVLQILPKDQKYENKENEQFDSSKTKNYGRKNVKWNYPFFRRDLKKTEYSVWRFPEFQQFPFLISRIYGIPEIYVLHGHSIRVTVENVN